MTMSKPPKVVDTARLLKLLEQWTRAEIISRHGPQDMMRICSHGVLEKQEEIRELVFGTSDLFKLSTKFGLDDYIGRTNNGKTKRTKKTNKTS
jgi:hypothetical protein